MDFNISPGMFASEKKFRPLDAGKLYDVLILGGGPAGLTAAIYCMRKGAVTGLIVKEIGGQVAVTAGVENYLGYRYINGIELVEKFKEQVFQFGIDYGEGGTITAIEAGDVKKIRMDDGTEYSSKAIIIATGESWKKLNVPGEDKFVGQGVAYCSTCDAPFFTGRKVVVVGGGNSGLEAVLDLARVAREVVLVHNMNRLTGEKVLVDKVGEFTNVRTMYDSIVTSINGGRAVESVSIKDRIHGGEHDIDAEGIFIEIGLVPNSGFARGVVELNKHGEIIVDSSCRTSVPGIFAAGDVTDVEFKQIIIAAGEGAKAALSACNYIMHKEAVNASVTGGA
jgi:NADH-dependent peroxiredoxin subunit F